MRKDGDSKIPRAALLIVALATLFRLVAAARIPLTEDEAYYWSWSRHLAFGYLDHPPAIAWVIASASFLGRSPLAVRLPSIVFEALAALALGRTARLLAGNARAEIAAATIFTLLPEPRLLIGEALPDGPFLFFWALTLWMAVRATKWPTPRTMALLGLALGGALLSRYFGWPLLAGVVAYSLAPEHRSLWKRGFWIAPLVAAIVYAPFIVWNATHDWINLAFTLVNRQMPHAFSIGSIFYYSTLRTFVVGLVLWVVAYYTVIRPKYTLLAWTALPFASLLLLLAFFETVESYWLLGPLASLCVGIGIAYARRPQRARRMWALLWAPPVAYSLAAVIFWVVPQGLQASILRASHEGLKGPLFSSVYVYQPLAAQARALAAPRGAVVLTNEYEIASELAFNGLSPLIVGSAPQVAQWRMWNSGSIPERALVLTFLPIARTPGFERLLEHAFARVRSGPTLSYTFAGTSEGTFYSTWCSRPVRDAAVILYGRFNDM